MLCHATTMLHHIFLLSSSPILLSYSRSWLLVLLLLALSLLLRSGIVTGVALQFWAKLGNPDQAPRVQRLHEESALRELGGLPRPDGACMLRLQQRR